MSGRFGLAGFGPGDLLGGGAQDFGEQLVAVREAERGVGFLDGDGPSGITDTDLDSMAGDADAASATDPPVDRQQVWDQRWGRAGGTSVANPAQLRRGEWIRQGPQHQPVAAEQVQNAVVDTDSDPLPGEVVADRMLTSGQGE